MTVAPVEIALPFAGRWLAMNSPARRVPSHGVDLFGERYAIDFVGVDDRHRTAAHADWRTVLHTEPPERFFSFGRPILAPADGVVVAVHDGEPDHEARRSQLALVPYALGQAARVRLGPAAVAGNYVVLELRESGAFAALVHLRSGTLRVAVGDPVVTGQQLAQCGNSGNSTQPHVHLQLMDSPDLAGARGVPVAFRGYREWIRGTRHPKVVALGLPGERSVVEPA
ncbi:M23 family metallopeptidase [Conyzicola sp.]|uniref:M23 family metallopeptidase n=1 Tax=Conyzicola sp. TaxID=1969404 RepID=UPI003988A301